VKARERRAEAREGFGEGAEGEGEAQIGDHGERVDTGHGEVV
jgi:hypothetical protein